MNRYGKNPSFSTTSNMCLMGDIKAVGYFSWWHSQFETDDTRGLSGFRGGKFSIGPSGCAVLAGADFGCAGSGRFTSVNP